MLQSVRKLHQAWRRRLGTEAEPDVNRLKAGDDHYRAYVGPPQRFGLLALVQMNLLHALGLEESDHVLDFGCGSLRLGRVLIPFLSAERYYGIDPNGWLMEAGFRHETGFDLKRLKRPRFSTNASFDCKVFGRRFDFIMAQSVITHSGPEHTRALIASAAGALEPDGIMALSYLPNTDDESLPEIPWTYPKNVRYPVKWLKTQAYESGLFWQDIDWYHPGASWALIARNKKRLPARDALLGLNGKPVTRWRA